MRAAATGVLPAVSVGLRLVVAPERRAVGRYRVDLPLLAVRRTLYPELVLAGVTAGGIALVDRGQAGPGQPGLLGVDRFGVGHLDPQVVQAAALTGVLQQHQLQ